MIKRCLYWFRSFDIEYDDPMVFNANNANADNANNENKGN